MIDVPYSHPAWIEIDLIQFKKNLKIIKEHIGMQTKLCLPVKSNAYGHGLIPIAHAAAVAGVDCLAVSCLQEGILLRQAKVEIPILVLGAIHIEQIPFFIEYDLEFTVSSYYKAQLVATACQQLNKRVKVHLEIDTGMNRTGVRIETAHTVLDFLQNNPYFILTGIYSHLATADVPHHSFSTIQIEKFIDFLNKHNINDTNIIRHLANSAGAACFKQAHLDMVRPGLLAFGYYPRQDLSAKLLAIKPCFTIRAKVAYFKKVFKGEGISYNHTHIAENDTHVLTIPVGYGDGLRRCLSNKAAVLLHGKRYPIVGNICMDQFMVDIGMDSGYVGDIVTIIGEDHGAVIPIEEHSQLCSTIPYEILCGFNNRLPRVYCTELGHIWENAENNLTAKMLVEV
jgi:alanine racemase